MIKLKLIYTLRYRPRVQDLEQKEHLRVHVFRRSRRWQTFDHFSYSSSAKKVISQSADEIISWTQTHAMELLELFADLIGLSFDWNWIAFECIAWLILRRNEKKRSQSALITAYWYSSANLFVELISFCVVQNCVFVYFH